MWVPISTTYIGLSFILIKLGGAEELSEIYHSSHRNEYNSFPSFPRPFSNTRQGGSRFIAPNKNFRVNSPGLNRRNKPGPLYRQDIIPGLQPPDPLVHQSPEFDTYFSPDRPTPQKENTRLYDPGIETRSSPSSYDYRYQFHTKRPISPSSNFDRNTPLPLSVMPLFHLSSMDEQYLPPIQPQSLIYNEERDKSLNTFTDKNDKNFEEINNQNQKLNLDFDSIDLPSLGKDNHDIDGIDNKEDESKMAEKLNEASPSEIELQTPSSPVIKIKSVKDIFEEHKSKGNTQSKAIATTETTIDFSEDPSIIDVKSHENIPENDYDYEYDDLFKEFMDLYYDSGETFPINEQYNDSPAEYEPILPEAPETTIDEEIHFDKNLPVIDKLETDEVNEKLEEPKYDGSLYDETKLDLISHLEDKIGDQTSEIIIANTDEDQDTTTILEVFDDDQTPKEPIEKSRDEEKSDIESDVVADDQISDFNIETDFFINKPPSGTPIKDLFNIVMNSEGNNPSENEKEHTIIYKDDHLVEKDISLEPDIKEKQEEEISEKQNDVEGGDGTEKTISDSDNKDYKDLTTDDTITPISDDPPNISKPTFLTRLKEATRFRITTSKAPSTTEATTTSRQTTTEITTTTQRSTTRNKVPHVVPVSLSEVLQDLGLTLPMFQAQLQTYDIGLPDFISLLRKKQFNKSDLAEAGGNLEKMINMLKSTDASAEDNVSDAITTTTLEVDITTSTTQEPQPSSPKTESTKTPKRKPAPPRAQAISLSEILEDLKVPLPVFLTQIKNFGIGLSEFTSLLTKKQLQRSDLTRAEGNLGLIIKMLKPSARNEQSTSSTSAPTSTISLRPYKTKKGAEVFDRRRPSLSGDSGIVRTRFGGTTRPTLYPPYEYQATVSLENSTDTTTTERTKYKDDLYNKYYNRRPEYNEEVSATNAIMAGVIIGSVALVLMFAVFFVGLCKNYMKNIKSRVTVPVSLSIADSAASSIEFGGTRSVLNKTPYKSAGFWGTLKKRFDPYSLSPAPTPMF